MLYLQAFYIEYETKLKITVDELRVEEEERLVKINERFALLEERQARLNKASTFIEDAQRRATAAPFFSHSKFPIRLCFLSKSGQLHILLDEFQGDGRFGKPPGYVSRVSKEGSRNHFSRPV